jgi:hypothetical protein
MYFQNDEQHPQWIAMRGTKFETSFSKHYKDGWYTVPENIFYTAKTHALQMVSPEKTNRRKACLRDGQSGKTGFALSLAFWMRRLLHEKQEGFYLRYLIQKSSVNLRSNIISDLKKMGWESSSYYIDILPNYKKKEQMLVERVSFTTNIPGNKPPHILTILDECHIAIAINGTFDKAIIRKDDVVADENFASEGWSFQKPSEEWTCDNHYVLSISATDTINNVMVKDAYEKNVQPPCDLFYIKPDLKYLGVEYLLNNNQLFQAREPFVSTKRENGTYKVELSDFEKEQLDNFFNHCLTDVCPRFNLVRRVPRCGGKTHNYRKGYDLFVNLVSDYLFNKGKHFQNFHINVLHSDFKDSSYVEPWYSQYPISSGMHDFKQSTLDILLQKNPSVPTINVITESMTIGERITTWENAYALLDDEYARADKAGQSIYRTCGYWDKDKHKVLVFGNIEGRRKLKNKNAIDISFLEFQEFYKDVDKHGFTTKYPASGYNDQKTRELTKRPVKLAIDATEVPPKDLKYYADEYLKQGSKKPHESINYSTYTLKDSAKNNPHVFVGFQRHLKSVSNSEKEGDWLKISGALSLCGISITEDEVAPEWKWGTHFADEMVKIVAPQGSKHGTPQHQDSFNKFDMAVRRLRWEKAGKPADKKPDDEFYKISEDKPVWLYREYPVKQIQNTTKISPNVLTGKNYDGNSERTVVS